MDTKPEPLTDAQFNAVRPRLAYALLGNGGETVADVVADARTLPATSSRTQAPLVSDDTLAYLKRIEDEEAADRMQRYLDQEADTAPGGRCHEPHHTRRPDGSRLTCAAADREELAEIMALVDRFGDAQFEMGQNAGEQNIMTDFDERSADVGAAYSALEQRLRQALADR